MNEEEKMEDVLEKLYNELGARTKGIDGTEHKKLLSQINETQKELFSNKIKPSTNGEGPEQSSILPQWSVSGKKVTTMKITKRRGDLDPMGF